MRKAASSTTRFRLARDCRSVDMVGSRRAYATSSLGQGGGDSRSHNAASVESTSVHSVRKVQHTNGYENNQHDDFTSGDSADEGLAKRNGYSRRGGGGYGVGGEVYGGDDDNDDFDDNDDDDELLERERELQREREEMKARFTFQEHKRRNLKSGMMDAMRRKRRMLMRNENLRFRELYKPPEPHVVLTVISLVTIVTLILTKSWPFY